MTVWIVLNDQTFLKAHDHLRYISKNGCMKKIQLSISINLYTNDRDTYVAVDYFYALFVPVSEK